MQIENSEIKYLKQEVRTKKKKLNGVRASKRTERC